MKFIWHMVLEAGNFERVRCWPRVRAFLLHHNMVKAPQGGTASMLAWASLPLLMKMLKMMGASCSGSHLILINPQRHHLPIPLTCIWTLSSQRVSFWRTHLNSTIYHYLLTCLQARCITSVFFSTINKNSTKF